MNVINHIAYPIIDGLLPRRGTLLLESYQNETDVVFQNLILALLNKNSYFGRNCGAEKILIITRSAVSDKWLREIAHSHLGCSERIMVMNVPKTIQINPFAKALGRLPEKPECAIVMPDVMNQTRQQKSQDSFVQMMKFYAKHENASVIFIEQLFGKNPISYCEGADADILVNVEECSIEERSATMSAEVFTSPTGETGRLTCTEKLFF